MDSGHAHKLGVGVRAILWDLDGTIADTEALHFRAWRDTLHHYHVTYDYEQFLAGFGRPNREILPALLKVAPDAPLVGEVADRKEATFRRLLHTDKVQLLSGVLTWLERFRKAGVLQAVSSSGPMGNIAAIVDSLDLGNFFECLISGAHLPRGKPDPAIFLNSAAALAVEPCLT